MSNQLLTRKLQRIQLLLLDVDGVLTDGTVWYSGQDTPYLAFNVQDGFGLRQLQKKGITVGVISGRQNRGRDSTHARIRD